MIKQLLAGSYESEQIPQSLFHSSVDDIEADADPTKPVSSGCSGVAWGQDLTRLSNDTLSHANSHRVPLTMRKMLDGESCAKPKNTPSVKH